MHVGTTGKLCFSSAGFALCGFGMGEPSSAQPQLMAAAVQHLPADKPRVAVGLVSSRSAGCSLAIYCVSW